MKGRIKSSLELVFLSASVLWVPAVVVGGWFQVETNFMMSIASWSAALFPLFFLYYLWSEAREEFMDLVKIAGLILLVGLVTLVFYSYANPY